ncbi:MAG: multidrug effflux MFS transporter [Gammaproteobacteria bacterium]|nr:multidrug effflux MFS transporter [Gammaproteobacteria bacterium]
MKAITLIFILAVLFAAVGSVSSDLYLPSLPAIAEGFHVSISLTQISVAVFVLGLCLARILFGPISDACGRKRPLIFGLVICFGGSLCCLFAPNIYILILGRLLQGFGAGGSNTLGRVILRDRLEGVKLAEFSSYFSMAGIAMMASAPLFGGYIQHYFGWRACFLILSVFTIVALLAAIFLLPETNLYRNKSYLKPKVLIASLTKVFTDCKFISYALLLLLSYAALLAWLTSGPVILQKVIGLTPVMFGWIAGLVGVCYFCGAFINSRWVSKVGIHKMLMLGSCITFLVGLFMLISGALHYLNAEVIVIPVMLAIFGLSLIVPNSYAAGLSPFPKTAGVAVAMLGTIQVIGGFVASTLIAILPDKSQLPLGCVFFLTALLSIVVVFRLITMSSSKT